MPVVRPGDVLVRVRATGITLAELTWDETYQNADGTPRIPAIPGYEPSGVVEETALDVTDFRAGDEVYGLADFPRDGAAAEFAAVRAANLALKPRSIPHVQAANPGVGSRWIRTVVQAAGGGVFRLPRVETGMRSVELRASELAMVLDGIDVSRLKRVTRYAREAGASRE